MGKTENSNSLVKHSEIAFNFSKEKKRKQSSVIFFLVLEGIYLFYIYLKAHHLIGLVFVLFICWKKAHIFASQ